MSLVENFKRALAFYSSTFDSLEGVYKPYAIVSIIFLSLIFGFGVISFLGIYVFGVLGLILGSILAGVFGALGGIAVLAALFLLLLLFFVFMLGWQDAVLLELIQRGLSSKKERAYWKKGAIRKSIALIMEKRGEFFPYALIRVYYGLISLLIGA
ncbi:MAG: hypothetical protein QW035_01705 [Candidatus Anstonellales archaeon]